MAVLYIFSACYISILLISIKSYTSIKFRLFDLKYYIFYRNLMKISVKNTGYTVDKVILDLNLYDKIKLLYRLLI